VHSALEAGGNTLEVRPSTVSIIAAVGASRRRWFKRLLKAAMN
jgi:hypothetical protein